MAFVLLVLLNLESWHLSKEAMKRLGIHFCFIAFNYHCCIIIFKNNASIHSQKRSSLTAADWVSWSMLFPPSQDSHRCQSDWCEMTEATTSCPLCQSWPKKSGWWAKYWISNFASFSSVICLIYLIFERCQWQNQRPYLMNLSSAYLVFLTASWIWTWDCWKFSTLLNF